jgi:O-antigen/teichoic acid export membrane protein
VTSTRSHEDVGTPGPAFRIGRQFAWLSAGRVVAALLQAVMMLLLLRSVSPAEFGFFAAAYGVITVPQVLFDAGLPSLVVRERARDRNSGLSTSALRLVNILAAVMAVLLTSIAVVLAVTVSTAFWLLVPLGLWGAAERSADAWLLVAVADGDSRVNVLTLVLRRIANLALFLGFTALTPIDPVLALSLSLAAAASGSWLLARWYVLPRLAPAVVISRRDLIALSYPYWIDSVATQARNLDAAITGLVASPMQAGFYAAAARLTGPLRILPYSLATVLLPATARKTARTVGPVLKLVFLATLAFGLFYAVLILLLPWAVPVVLGPAYSGAVLTLQITAGALVFSAAASMLDPVLQGLGMPHFVAANSIVTTVTCLIGVSIGATYGGAAGAALGLGFSYFVQASALCVRLAVFRARAVT